MQIEQKELKNGLDLLLHCYLTLETMDAYKYKGQAKKYGNLFRNSLEKQIMKGIDEKLQNDEEFINNAIKKKDRMIKQIANMNEVDQILLSDFVDRFNDNKEIARKKGITFFDKLL